MGRSAFRIAAAAAVIGALCATAAEAQRRQPRVRAQNPPPRAAPPAPPAEPEPPPPPAPPKPSEPMSTYLPKTGLEDFVLAQFDIRTVNSTMNIGRESYQARVREVGYQPQSRARPEDPLVLIGPNGTIKLTLFERGDHNYDAIEDVLVCMTDTGRETGVTSQQILVLQKYSANTPLVALAVALNDPRCPPLP